MFRRQIHSKAAVQSSASVSQKYWLTHTKQAWTLVLQETAEPGRVEAYEAELDAGGGEGLYCSIKKKSS